MSLVEKAMIGGVIFLIVGAVALIMRQPRAFLKPADTRVGERVYQQNCATCHGTRAEGQGAAPPLNWAGHADHHPDWELYSFISEGKAGFGQMPAWRNRLSDHEIRSVIAYMKTLWTEEQRRAHRQLNEIRPGPPGR